MAIPFPHALLQRNCTFNCIYNTSELSKKTISSMFENVATVLSDDWLEYFLAVGTQQFERTSFITFSHASKANHVCCKDGNEATLGAIFSHVGPLFGERIVFLPVCRVYSASSGMGLNFGKTWKNAYASGSCPRDSELLNASP